MPNLYKFELPSSSKLMIALRNGLKPNLLYNIYLEHKKNIFQILHLMQFHEILFQELSILTRIKNRLKTHELARA